MVGRRPGVEIRKEIIPQTIYLLKVMVLPNEKYN
jgi:hypothetical protein